MNAEMLPVVRCHLCGIDTPHHDRPEGLVCAHSGCGETADPDPLGDALRAAEALGHRLIPERHTAQTAAPTWRCTRCRRFAAFADGHIAGVDAPCPTKETL